MNPRKVPCVKDPRLLLATPTASREPLMTVLATSLQRRTTPRIVSAFRSTMVCHPLVDAACCTSSTACPTATVLATLQSRRPLLLAASANFLFLQVSIAGHHPVMPSVSCICSKSTAASQDKKEEVILNRVEEKSSGGQSEEMKN